MWRELHPLACVYPLHCHVRAGLQVVWQLHVHWEQLNHILAALLPVLDGQTINASFAWTALLTSDKPAYLKGMRHAAHERLRQSYPTCCDAHPLPQGMKSGGWFSRMGKSKSPVGPAKGSREGYQTQTDDIRRKYGDKMV